MVSGFFVSKPQQNKGIGTLIRRCISSNNHPQKRQKRQAERPKPNLQRHTILLNLVCLRYSAMPTHFQLNDSDFERRFADCTLPPEWFSHEAHLRLAHLHISKYGLERAIDNLCMQIKAYDAYWDDGTKFHRTLTEASAKVMHHFMSRSRSSDFRGLLEEFPKLQTNFQDLLKSHYSRTLLQEDLARSTFLEPDLLSF